MYTAAIFIGAVFASFHKIKTYAGVPMANSPSKDAHDWSHVEYLWALWLNNNRTAFTFFTLKKPRFAQRQLKLNFKRGNPSFLINLWEMISLSNSGNTQWLIRWLLWLLYLRKEDQCFYIRYVVSFWEIRPYKA